LPKHSRIAATALSYLVVVGVIGGFLVLAIPPAVNQTIIFSKQVPGYIDSLNNQQGPVREFLGQYGLEEQLDDAIDNAKAQANDFAKSVGTAFVSGVGSLLNGVITVLTVLVLTFLMLIEGPAWMRRVWALYTDDEKREHHRELTRRMFRVASGYVNGQVIVASIAAMSSLAVLLLLGAIFDLPFSTALPLAGVVFITSMIPMIGATLGAIIVTIVLLFIDISAALVFLAYFIVYQQIENNVIQPVVQSKTVELTALSVFTAVVLGISLLGIVGGILAIPIAGCIRVLVKDYIEHKEKESKSNPENLLHKAKKIIKQAAD